MVWQPPVGARATWTRTISAEDVEAYALITGDRNPLHFDEAFARRTRSGALIVHGGLTTGLFNALVAMELPGPGSVFLHREWDYPAPRTSVTPSPRRPKDRVAGRQAHHQVAAARRQDGTEVLRGECVVYTMLPG